MRETEETWVQSMDQGDSLEEGMAAHSSILSWKIPWTEETGHGVAKSQTWLKWLSKHGTDFLEIGSSFKTYLSSRQKKYRRYEQQN